LRDSRAALDRFDQLLRHGRREEEFQRLFADHPYILSTALPLRVEPCDIRPLGRPGRSEPDFIIYPAARTPTSGYGVIELKRPDSRILTEPRKGLLILSRDARTALAQGESYRQDLLSDPVLVDERLLALGNRAHVFVIMGMSTELTTKLGGDIYERQLAGQLPTHCQLIPYDTLFRAFNATVPPRITILVPALDTTGLAELVKLVADGLFDWRRFDLDDAALGYWKSIQDRASSLLGRNLDRIRRDKFVIIGSETGELATETDNPQSFAEDILGLLREIHDEAVSRGNPSELITFVDAVRTMLRTVRAETFESGPLSRQAMDALRSAVWECRTQRRSYAFMQMGDTAVEELRDAGLLRFNWYDSGESSYWVHPLARYGF
jgi:hypothetical protein